MTRGLVVPLTAEQRRARALYLAGLVTGHALDPHVRSPLVDCPSIWYRLEFPNGGDDPTAPSPAARWKKPGSSFENVTADCMAGVAWVQGFDRKQPVRASRVWGGALNCDSMLIEARTYGECFELLVDEHGNPRPELGAIVVYDSEDYDGDGDRDRVGHTGNVIGVPAEWDHRERQCWQELEVVDIAGRAGRANALVTGLTWFGNDKRGKPKNAQFLRCVMTP